MGLPSRLPAGQFLPWQSIRTRSLACGATPPGWLATAGRSAVSTASSLLVRAFEPPPGAGQARLRSAARRQPRAGGSRRPGPCLDARRAARAWPRRRGHLQPGRAHQSCSHLVNHHTDPQHRASGRQYAAVRRANPGHTEEVRARDQDPGVRAGQRSVLVIWSKITSCCW